jgi:flagellar biosynthesis/type III secretory pathway protein FliH
MKDLEWFEIHLEHINSPEDFEEAMELAHVKGFEDGFEAGEEEGYNSGIYSSVVEENIEKAVKSERERIVKLLEPLGCEANGVEHDCQNGLGYTTAQDLIKLINGEK